MTPNSPEILIRSCNGFEEFDACVRLQTEVWGYDVRDTIPLREFIVIQRIGGQIMGAFDMSQSGGLKRDATNLIGFVMSMPGIIDRQAYLHSHMLAVLPAYRNCGIGRKLKMAQRRDALSRGIERMEWTFDPLEIKNAYLNIVRLGAVVHSYTPNFYGVFSSRLQGGLPTDRLHAEWWMGSPRVEAVLSGRSPAGHDIVDSITVPGAIKQWKQSADTFARAEAVQAEVRTRFLDAFARGLTVVGFKRELNGDELNGVESAARESDGVYLLAVWQKS